MFVAVWPDDATMHRLSLLELGTARGLRLVGPRQWHITLRFLGDVDDDLAPALVTAIGAATGSMERPVHCEVGPATAWFASQRVLQLPVAGLEEAAGAVWAATVPLVPSAQRGNAGFRGHLTLARATRRMEGATRARFAGIRFTATFAVESFDLVASYLSSEGPRYTTLGRVALSG